MKKPPPRPRSTNDPLWVLDFHRKDDQGHLELVIPQNAQKTAPPLMNPAEIEQIKQDTKALKDLEKLCETLKKECLNELEKNATPTDNPEQISESLNALDDLMHRFINILNRFRNEG